VVGGAVVGAVVGFWRRRRQWTDEAFATAVTIGVERPDGMWQEGEGRTRRNGTGVLGQFVLVVEPGRTQQELLGTPASHFLEPSALHSAA
jgi:hypothetical protein